MECVVRVNAGHSVIIWVRSRARNVRISGSCSEAGKAGDVDGRQPIIYWIVESILELQNILAVGAFLKLLLQVSVHAEAGLIEKRGGKDVGILQHTVLRFVV